MGATMIKKLILFLFFLLISFNVEAANRFAVCTVTCTWDGSSTAMWSTSTGGTTGASVPGSADAVILDAATCVGGVTCTITVNTGFNVLSVTMGACTAATTGCILDFSVNNNSPTIGTFSNSGTGTRNLKMGSGTWTINGTNSTLFDHGTITGLTFNCSACTILVQAASAPGSQRFLVLNTLTYNAITINDPVETTKLALATTGNFTVTTLTITNAYWLQFTGGGTVIVTNNFSWNNTSSTPGLLNSQSVNNGTTLQVGGTVTMSWVAIQNVTKAGAGSITATNSFDLGGNTGVTITVPAGGARIIGG